MSAQTRALLPAMRVMSRKLGRRQQRVARSLVLAGLGHEHVGQDVGQMAHEGQDAVVLVGSTATGRAPICTRKS